MMRGMDSVLGTLPKIGAPATRALNNGGYTALRELAGVPRAELAELRRAYFHQNEIRPEPGPTPTAMNQLRASVDSRPDLRLANLDRLRLVVRVVPAHDPWEFQRYAAG